jgi:preprotein translocase subunit SecY
MNVVVIRLLFGFSYYCLCSLTWLLEKPAICARHTASGDFEQDMMGGNRQWIPLKLNASGVMPIILLKQLCLYLLLASFKCHVWLLLHLYFRFWYNLVLQFVLFTFSF